MHKWGFTDPNPGSDCGAPNQNIEDVIRECPKRKFNRKLENILNATPEALFFLGYHSIPSMIDYLPFFIVVGRTFSDGYINQFWSRTLFHSPGTLSHSQQLDIVDHHFVYSLAVFCGLSSVSCLRRCSSNIFGILWTTRIYHLPSSSCYWYRCDTLSYCP